MKKFYLILFSALLLSSCNKTDTTPAWLIIDEFSLTTDEPTQGPNSNAIDDAWIYMDNQPIGVYSLPAKVPILAEGQHDFIIYPGVKRHGISADRLRYPFYERYETTLNLVKGEELQVTPQTNYKPEIYIHILEDFEDVGVDFISESNSLTDMIAVDDTQYPEIIKYGSNCGLIHLTQSDSLYQGATNTNLNLPKSGQEVWVELDYLCSNSSVLSLKAENSSSSVNQPPLVGFNTRELDKENWIHLYIDLKENVSFEVYATSFEVYILSILDPENTEGFIFIDNFKVISYQ